MVFFRKSDVVAAGDVFVLDGYPVIDPARGGSLQGVIDALNRLVDIAIPEFNTLGGTRIVPGHGRIANEIDAVEYRDMLTIIRDRVALLVGEGRTLEQVQAARVSLDYDGVYGATSGPWTTDAFIAAAYRELSAAAARERSSRAAPGSGARRTPAAAATAAAPSRLAGRGAAGARPIRSMAPGCSTSPGRGIRRRRTPRTVARRRLRSRETPCGRAPRRGAGCRATIHRCSGSPTPRGSTARSTPWTPRRRVSPFAASTPRPSSERQPETRARRRRRGGRCPPTGRS